MSDRSIIQVVALIVLGCIAIAIIIAYGIFKTSPASNLEESKRMTVCVESGGNWTDVNPRKQSFKYGCVRP